MSGRILVTGARGFIGRSLCSRLERDGLDVVRATRTPVPGGGDLEAPELGPNADWSSLLSGADIVIHLAGRAHVISEKASPSVEEDYHRINAAGTSRLARQAREAGVRQIIFLSSCHAVASESDIELTRSTAPYPSSAYGRSKLEGERALAEVLDGSSTGWTVLRPPLVYGPGNLANFRRLITLVRSGLPLPFGSVCNRRSFIGVDNLADIISCCIGNKNAHERIYFPCDGDPVSTPELVRKIARALGKPDRVFSVPELWLKTISQLPGLDVLRKLMASLFVSPQGLHEDLGWTPPLTLEQGLSMINHQA